MISGPALFSVAETFDFSVLVLLAVFGLTALRQVGSLRLQIWQIMFGGALAVLLSGKIGVLEALEAVDPDVMLFLFGMFVVGEGLNRSGYLEVLAGKLLGRARSVDGLVLLLIFAAGGLSALLMNDTVAIMGTPLVLELSRRYRLSPKLLLLALAFGVTTGSVMSPIGNPQNLLIAVQSGFENPFLVFFRYLGVATLLNLFVVYLVLRLGFSREFRKGPLELFEAEITDPELARASKFSLLLLLGLVACKVGVLFLAPELDFRLTWIALLASLPVLLSRRRMEILKKLDWQTLVFFASMFVLMQSVWDSGFFQGLLAVSGFDPTALPIIFLLSIGLSQLISNVPFVALYLPTMGSFGASGVHCLALAAGSTIAGNFMILGAASNVIILQNAEKKGFNLSFFDFLSYGSIITVLNTFIYLFLLNRSLSSGQI